MINNQMGEVQGIIESAYKYFRGVILEFIRNQEKEDTISDLFTTITKDFGVVRIAIDSTTGDESEKVFESLNNTGKLLREFDRLKNHLFLRARRAQSVHTSPGFREELYTKYWTIFDKEFDRDEDKEFDRDEAEDWREEFLKTFLIAKLGSSKSSKEPNLFNKYCKEHQKALEEKREVSEDDPELIEHEFKELHDYADTYICEIRQPGDKSRPSLEFVNKLKIKELYAFILYAIRESKLHEGEVEKVLNSLESYTIRQMLCTGKVSHKRVNDFLSGVLAQSKKFEREEFVYFLQTRNHEQDKWPSDEKVKDALSKAGNKGSLLIRYILYRIEQYKKHSLYSETALNFSRALTREHIMPKKWEEGWPLLEKNGRDLYFTDLYSNEFKKTGDWENHPALEGLAEPKMGFSQDDYKKAHFLAIERKKAVQSIGNLTLFTKASNSHAGSVPFGKKKDLLEHHTTLTINREIFEANKWDVEEIRTREVDLFECFKKLWPAPQSPDGEQAIESNHSWISKINDYLPVRLVTTRLDSRAIVDLSRVEATVEDDTIEIYGTNEQGEDEALSDLNVCFICQKKSWDDFPLERDSSLSPMPITDRKYGIRIPSLILKRARYEKSIVELVLHSGHSVRGTISGYDNHIIDFTIEGQNNNVVNIIILRLNILRLVAEQLYEGTVNWWYRHGNHGTIQCTEGRGKAWTDIQVTDKSFAETCEPLGVGQKVSFFVQVIKDAQGYTNLQAACLKASPQETYQGTVSQWNGIGREGRGTIQSDAHKDKKVEVKIQDIVDLPPSMFLRFLHKGQKLQYKIQPREQGKGNQYTAYDVKRLPDQDKQVQGVVESFNENRGFGRIRTTSPPQRVFLHISEVLFNGNQTGRTITRGNKVVFEIAEGTRGPSAFNVLLSDD